MFDLSDFHLFPPPPRLPCRNTLRSHRLLLLSMFCGSGNSSDLPEFTLSCCFVCFTLSHVEDCSYLSPNVSPVISLPVDGRLNWPAKPWKWRQRLNVWCGCGLRPTFRSNHFFLHWRETWIENSLLWSENSLWWRTCELSTNEAFFWMGSVGHFVPRPVKEMKIYEWCFLC